MAKNQALPGPPTSRRFAKCPSTVVAGDLVLLGSIPAVALDNYQSNEGGTTFDTGGTFVISVTAASQLSPLVGSAAAPGDKLYLSGETLDGTTNVSTGGTVCRVTGGVHIGFLDPQYQTSVTSGSTDANAWVKLLGSE